MKVLTRVRELLGEDAVYECRRCGTTLGADVTECPTCGTGEVVRYEIT
jgi:rubrerythrin